MPNWLQTSQRYYQDTPSTTVLGIPWISRRVPLQELYIRVPPTYIVKPSRLSNHHALVVHTGVLRHHTVALCRNIPRSFWSVGAALGKPLFKNDSAAYICWSHLSQEKRSGKVRLGKTKSKFEKHNNKNVVFVISARHVYVLCLWQIKNHRSSQQDAFKARTDALRSN